MNKFLMNPADILLITPPITQLNAPYPAAAYLTAYLKKNGINAYQLDLSIELIDAVFNQEFLSRLIANAVPGKKLSRFARAFTNRKDQYLSLVNPVKSFLRGNNQTLANRICQRNLLPEGLRFKQAKDLDWWFGNHGKVDRARHLSTLFLLDIADFIREVESPYFDMTRYAEKLSILLPTFTPLQEALDRIPNLVDEVYLNLLDKHLSEKNPRVVAFTIPFPGNLYSALRCAQFIKRKYQNISIVLGGGYINTELRTMSDTRIFDYVDYILFDDGELPLHRLLSYLKDKRTPLLRTMIRIEDEVRFINPSPEGVPVNELPAPDYSDLNPDKYLSLIELPNPMHSLWNNGYWNKLQLTRGCYWAKCTFCDTSLPYISRFESRKALQIADEMEEVIGQTGQTGFHFVDEASPPTLLHKLSEEIVKRKLMATWWTNIRFEKNFTEDLCALMSDAGCIAVSGGIEVASDRILRLINKGVTIEQAARTCANFRNSDIMVHAYLMYGFPGETEQETIDSLEVVRQFFQNGLFQSGFFHRYAMTCHSLTGKQPQDFGVKRVTFRPNPFANNEVPYIESLSGSHEKYGKGLEKAILNYMMGIGIDDHINRWFEFKVPLPSVPPNYIHKILNVKQRQ